MPTLLTQIESQNWTLSVDGLGEVVTDMDDVIQCVDIILSTTAGTDPLRPTFGSNIWRYQDLPVNEAIPKIVPEIINAIKLWEPRASVQAITYTVTDLSNVQFNVTLQTTVSSEALLYVFNLYETAMTPYPVFFTDTLVLVSTGDVGKDGITGIASPGSDGAMIEFNPIVPLIGLPVSANLRVGSLASTIMAIIDYPTDYVGQPFRFTSPAGVQYTTNFPAPGTTPGGAIDFILK